MIYAAIINVGGVFKTSISLVSDRQVLSFLSGALPVCLLKLEEAFVLSGRRVTAGLYDAPFKEALKVKISNSFTTPFHYSYITLLAPSCLTVSNASPFVSVRVLSL